MRIPAGILLSLFIMGMAPAIGPATAAVLNRGNGAEPKSLDPHYIDGVWEANIVGDMLMGLTTEDAAGRPVPGAADRWTVSADGKSWTFHIRRAIWSDGVPVTSHDFVFAFERLLDPKTAAQYAYNLWVFKNAHAISDGKLPPSALGVEAPNDETLIIHLEHPAAYLPELLTHNTAYPLPRHIVLAKGNAWVQPQNYVVNGPYKLLEWVPNDHISLVKNPRFYDAAHVRIDRVNFYPIQNGEAGLNRFRAGELDIQTAIPMTQVDWVRRNLKNMLHVSPYLGISYIDLNLGYGPLKDVRVRKALNLAYNREVVADKILKLGQIPAYAYVPPGVANFPGGAAMDFKSLAYPARLALAQKLMQGAGYGPGKHLRLAYETGVSPDSLRIAAVLQAMLRPIYVDLQIAQADTQIHYKNMQVHQFQMGGAGWIADFNDASNFLDLLRSDSGNNYGQYKNPKFDAMMNAAQAEPDAAKRGQLLLAAEKIAIADYPWLVTYFLVTEDLVQPYVKGWVDNARDINRTRWLWIAK